MASVRPLYYEDPYATIDSLRRELDRTRMAFIDMMPLEIRSLLWTFFKCESRHEAYAWPDKVAGELVKLADVVKTPYSERANCPLCRSEGGSACQSGYSVPVGLTRHLTGYGNVRECPVMAAARGIARDHWNEKFSPAETLAASEKKRELQRRMVTETLFSSGPDSKPELYDAKSGLVQARNREEMAAARSRLEELQFKGNTVGNVESYVHEYDQHIVFADPRAKGNIEFKAYRCLPLSSAKGSKPKFKLVGHFRMPDRWKNDLSKKYQDWLATVTADVTKEVR